MSAPLRRAWRALTATPDTANSLRGAFWFGRVDGRPASVFRIAFALWLLKDALFHLPLATFFYSDLGVVPREALLQLGRDARFSVMDAMPHAWMAALFFLLWAGVALGLLLGYRTRALAVVNFLIVLSIHERDVYVLTGADSMMRALSFWMIFIPLNAYYSLDARRARREGRSFDRTGYAFPVRMMQLQVAVVYLFAGGLKAIGPLWTGGEAMAYVLQLNTLLLPFGIWLRDTASPGLLAAMTHVTVVGELAFGLLVFAPFAQPLLRVLALLFGVALHLGIGLMLSIPDFSTVMILSYLIFLPPDWLAAAERGLRAQLGWPTAAVWPAEGQPLRRAVPRREWAGRAALTAGLTLAMLGVVWWNVDYLADYDAPLLPMPAPLKSVMWYSGLWQYWDLFAPMPIQVDGWITIPGRFEDDTTLDLRTGLPPTGALQHIQSGPWVRWEKFEENVFNWAYTPILRAWGRYYCREYNIVQARPEGQRLATLEIIYRSRRSVAPGEPPNAYTDALLWTHWCYEQYAE
jgi:hypothetical protein